MTAGKAVIRRRIGPMGKGASAKGRAMRLAGLAAGTFGGPAGAVAMFGADYLAERADQHHRGDRAEQQVVQHQRPLAADRRKQTPALQLRRAPSEQG